MKEIISGNRFTAALFGIALLAMSAWANADPPFRAARVAYLAGPVSFAPAGTDDWVLTTINRPLVTGDRLWADAGGRAELQAGASTIRLGDSTSLTVLNLDNTITQLQLAQGTLNFRVRRLAPGEIFEVDTPNLAFTVQQPGAYRIDVDASGNATSVVVRSGQGEVTGEGAAYFVDPQTSYRFAGSGLGDYDSYAPPPPDDFERWAGDRDRRGDNSVSMRYVSPDVVGYEDLDDQGSWRNDPENGYIWVPTHVVAGWSPYHDGHWAWIDPYGWTWVDDAPWGFAVSHYGRWAYVGNTWGWVPGPIAVRPVYAPALVAFVGGSGFSLSLSIGGGGGGIAWFPLGPRDVYRPAYPVSREYFTNINSSGTRITTTNITNVYNTTNVTNITYVNQRVPGAVVAVPSAAFSQSRSVAQAAVPVPAAALAKATVMPVAAVAPTATSVSGAAKPGGKPPAAAMSRPMVAKTAPPPAPVPFAAKQQALTANAGKPLDAQQEAAVKPAISAPAHPVTVVKSAPKPAAPPPPKPASAPGKVPKPAQTTPAPATAPKPPEAKPAPANVPRPPEAKQAPEAKPAQETRPAPAEPKNVPKPPEARPAPEAKPAVAPKPEPKPEVRPPEAKPAPKPEQKPEVRPPEAKPAPRPEPKPEPKPAPQAKPPEPAAHAAPPPHEEHKPEPKKEDKREEKKE
jgi:hypothetical protein